jgi:hypothetical protein
MNSEKIELIHVKSIITNRSNEDFDGVSWI